MPPRPKSPSPPSLGRATGSAAARRLRHEGKVPGVVYGQGADALTVTVVRRSCASRSPARPATTR